MTKSKTKSMTKESVIISQLQQDIINNSQKGFPLTKQPYKTIAEQLAQVNIVTNELRVFLAIDDLINQEVLSRVGPVFDHKKAGASTLAALAVPKKDLDKIAGIVNQFEQINHNYGREGSSGQQKYNLWFVVTASNMVALNNTLANIELLTGLAVLVLPMEASYHIDLAFSINVTGVESPTSNQEAMQLDTVNKNDCTRLTEIEKIALRSAIEKGLPASLLPYRLIAQQLALTEQQVLMQISHWQEEGLIRRFGLVIKLRSRCRIFSQLSR